MFEIDTIHRTKRRESGKKGGKTGRQGERNVKPVK